MLVIFYEPGFVIQMKSLPPFSFLHFFPSPRVSYFFPKLEWKHHSLLLPCNGMVPHSNYHTKNESKNGCSSWFLKIKIKKHQSINQTKRNYWPLLAFIHLEGNLPCFFLFGPYLMISIDLTSNLSYEKDINLWDCSYSNVCS